MEIKIKCSGTEYLGIDTLETFQDGLKTLSNSNLKKLKKNIIENGFIAPFFIWKNKTHYKILDGHQRIAALKSMQHDGYIIPEMPVVYIQADSEKDARKKLLSITSSFGEFDTDILKEWAFDFDNDIFRFTGSEIDFRIEEETEDDDEIPEEVKPITKLGDLWELGNHRLLCGDSTKSENVEKLMDGKKADVYVIDPPYDNINLYDIIPENVGKKLLVFWDFKRFAIAPYKAILNGWEPQYEFIWDCVTSWYTPNRPLARHKACGYFCKDPKFLFDKAILPDNKKRTSKIVSNNRGKTYYTPIEGGHHIRTIEEFPTTQENGNHEHSKPEKWIESIMNGIGGNLYCDYFAGSGVFLIACEKTSRICYGMELDEHYCDVIVKRYIDWCGKNHRECTVKLNGNPVNITEFANDE